VKSRALPLPSPRWLMTVAAQNAARVCPLGKLLVFGSRTGTPPSATVSEVRSGRDRPTSALSPVFTRLDSTPAMARARTARARSKVVVALGDCAVTGNVPSLRNGIPVRTLLKRVYVEGATERPGSEPPVVPTDGVPALLKQAEPLHSAIKVDVHVPGCPPRPNAILFVLSELLEGRTPDLGSKMRFG